MPVPDSAEYWWDVNRWFERRRLNAKQEVVQLMIAPTVHVCCGQKHVGRIQWKKHKSWHKAKGVPREDVPAAELQRDCVREQEVPQPKASTSNKVENSKRGL